MGEAFHARRRRLADAREVAYALDGAGWARPNRYFGGASPAAAMQKLEREWARELNQDFCVEAWRRGLPIGRSIVVDDVQLLNEAAAIRQLGGKLIRIKGISRHPLPSNAFSRAPGVEALEADATIVNDGGIGALWRNVMALAA